MTSSSNSFSLYTSTVQPGPSAPPYPLLMQHSRPILAFKSLIPLPPTSYLLHLHFYHRLMFLAVSLHLLLPFPPDSLNGMLGVSEPKTLKLYTFLSSHPVDLICIHISTSIHLPLSRFLDSLLCDLITPTPGLAFSLMMPHTLAAASSFLSGRT